LDLYRFVHSPKSSGEGVGRGDGQVGDKAKIPKEGAGSGSGAGNNPGDLEQEVFVPIEQYIDILLEELALPNIQPKAKKTVVAYDEDIEGLRRTGPETTLDKRATLLANLKRNAIQGNPQIGNWSNEDLRYLDYEMKPVLTSPLIIYLILDRSGSMDKDKRDVAKTFFFLVVEILKRLYGSRADIKFIMYDTEAAFVQERDFFELYSTGGTMVSKGLALALGDFKRQPGSNGYIFIASDGDNWAMDNADADRLLRECLGIFNYVFYLEVRVGLGYTFGAPLSDHWDKLAQDEKMDFNQYVLTSSDEIFFAIRKFLKSQRS